MCVWFLKKTGVLISTAVSVITFDAACTNINVIKNKK